MTRIISSLLTGVAGFAMLLAGLGVDAWLHAQDETLAAREGIFTLSNPGHLLLGIGVALTGAGILAALYFAWGMTKARGILGRAWVRVIAMQASGAATIGAVIFALAVSASGHDHGHGGVASAAAEPRAHASSAAMQSASTDDSPPHTHDMTTANGGRPSSAVESPAQSQESDAERTAPAVGATHLAHAFASAGGSSTGMVPASAPPDEMQMHPDGMPAAGGAVAAAHDHPQPTTEERACFAELTAEAKAATQRFADINAAISEGYILSDDPTKTHMPNPTYMRDGRSLDLAYPESLVYVSDASGGRRFVGALYRALKGQGPTPCGNATYWHTHGRCIAAGGTAIPENKDKTCPAGYAHREGAVEMMHIWFVPKRER